MFGGGHINTIFIRGNAQGHLIWARINNGGWAFTRNTKNRGPKSEILTKRGMGENEGPGISRNQYGRINLHIIKISISL